MDKQDLAQFFARSHEGQKDFAHGDLEGLVMPSWSVLQSMRFAEADLSGAVFRNCTLVHCDFHRANLTEANFEGATIIDGKFEGANLRSACFVTAHAPRLFARGANLEGASFLEAYIPGASFVDATGRNASFAESHLEQATFHGASLPTARFCHADLRGALFSDGVLHNADFNGANCRGANFCRADLTEAYFRSSQLKKASFTLANTVGVRWPSALEILQANWHAGVPSERTVADLMLLDAMTHNNPDAFREWAIPDDDDDVTGLCPYGSASDAERAASFCEDPNIWRRFNRDRDVPFDLYGLAMRCLAETVRDPLDDDEEEEGED